MSASPRTFDNPASIFRPGVPHPRYRHCLAASTIALLLAVNLSACATRSAYQGHRATDLSGVNHGELRARIEATLGQPEKVEVQETTSTAWYVIDRGFVGTLESASPLEKLLWAPVMAWGEFVSLGLAGLMVACAVPCQKGWLVVVYDGDGRVTDVGESFLPDEHPLVAPCAGSAVRADVGICQGVRERVRPTSRYKSEGADNP